MSTKFFENQKTYEKIGKLLAPLTVENVAQFLFFFGLPSTLPFIGHLPGCVVYQGQFAEIIASLQRSNGPFAMYHNVNGAFE